ncbi:MAG: hypothetical protein K940chlam3_01577 [Chlamydiae bacterium]|nr:hypothetical protein [Chlamydiota bacterium]
MLCVQPILLFSFQPLTSIKSDKTYPTLINSVSFHPNKNLFCVTFTHHQQVGLYQIDMDDSVELVQMLENPTAMFFHPQNAIFSPDGNHLVIVNWTTRDFNIYPADIEGCFQNYPQSTIPFHLSEGKYRPHGMCFSQDGAYLAVVYGSFEDSPWIVILYRVEDLDSAHPRFLPCSSLTKNNNLKGVPKGVAFSPDQSSLVITFTKTNSLGIFPINWEKSSINPIPLQEISGPATQLGRPEDIAFSPDGDYCAVSNSSQNTVSFYYFDKWNNRFIGDVPFKILGGEETPLFFPHGICFSHDSKYFAITQFGLVELNAKGYLTSWGSERLERISLFKVDE